MVPGSTLMYGSSLRMETRRPRALSNRPMLAAVMPFPREEVTPPVTKTYVATGQVLRGFFQCYRTGPPEARREAPFRAYRERGGGTCVRRTQATRLPVGRVDPIRPEHQPQHFVRGANTFATIVHR